MPPSFNFKPTGSSGFGNGEIPHVYRPIDCCDDAASDAADGCAGPSGRTRLHQLHAHLHCSIVGTCLGTAELRKIVARLTDVDASHASDVEIHHEGVTLAGDRQGGKMLTKALDRRHESAIQAFARARDAEALTVLWKQALQNGAIPGAYWALMSHRHATPELRQRAFGDVHMLSHLVGAANRADIRRLTLLERENADWRERADDRQTRIGELLSSQEELKRQCERLSLENAALRSRAADPACGPDARDAELMALNESVRLQTQRREAAEQSLAIALARQQEAQQDADRMRQLNASLGRELDNAEAHFRALAAPRDDAKGALARAIEGWKILYVGGRPSSTPAIRQLVADAGAQLVHHDGGMEDRKGLLAGAIGGANIVVFPVDCVDHDSMNHLKRLCARHEVPFLALRTASVTCFAATLSAFTSDAPAAPDFQVCLRHG
jgi:hypothetical protein